MGRCTLHRPTPGGRLLDVTGFRHFAQGEALAVGQGLIDALLTGQSGRDLLADVVADALELGDRNELNACVGHGIARRVSRVGGQDRFLDGGGERRRIEIGLILVGRLPGARRRRDPAFRFAHKLHVVC